jgi:signal peptidase II
VKPAGEEPETPKGAPFRVGLQRRLPWLLVPLAVLWADWATKIWILTHLVPGMPRPVVSGCFSLTLGFNRGAIFGIFAGAPEALRAALFLVAGAVALLYFGYELLKPSTPALNRVALGLIIGGALGNGVDRLHNGAVVDFLDAYWKDWHYPAFNVADSCIVCGAILLLLVLVLGARGSRPAGSPGN